MNFLHSNELMHESSPYLLQHAHNPVDWHPWSMEVLETAKKLDKPILVSIGYSACHWCHVMERESFENIEVAEFMNANFINIKIDREERPDLDHIYMEAVQMLNGNGGWPLNVFLTPDGRPFYGGTYFPPKPAFNRPSWLDVLYFISDIWKTRRADVENQANQLISHIGSADKNFISSKFEINIDSSREMLFGVCREIRDNILKSADLEFGGFGNAPKFPQFFCISYLLEYSHFCKDDEALKHAIFSIDSMLNGGIYDQLGGGLARYSTDKEWLVPHFEKMLYDNALLIAVLSETYQITGDSKYKHSIDKTLEFCLNELKHPEGGFFSAIDADSEGEEGKYYVWDIEEIKEALKDDSNVFCDWYGITVEGNWEGKNILHLGKSKTEFVLKHDIALADFENLLKRCELKLLTHRKNRIRPQTDDKILLGWNALMLSALCKASVATSNEAYLSEAKSLFEFIEASFTRQSLELYHDYKNNKAKNHAFLDDYAFLIDACIQLHEITGDWSFLFKAKAFTEYVVSNFSIDGSPFFSYTSAKQQDVVVRKIEIYDSAIPSGNSVMAKNLHYLSLVFEDRIWENLVYKMLGSLTESIRKDPSSFGLWSALFLTRSIGTIEVVVTGLDYAKHIWEFKKLFLPNGIILGSSENKEIPLLIGKKIEKKALIYVCKDKVCSEPFDCADTAVDFIKKNNFFNIL